MGNLRNYGNIEYIIPDENNKLENYKNPYFDNINSE